MDKVPENIALKDRTWPEWRKFRQKLEIFLVATKRTREPDAVRVALLLASGGDIVLDEFTSRFSAAAQTTVKFNDGIATLEENVRAGESEHFLSHNFRERRQQSGETVAAWLPELRLLVKNCNYGD